MHHTEVDEEHLIGLDDCLIGLVVNLPSGCSGRDDGSEGWAIDFFMLRDGGNDQALNRALGHAGSDARDDGVEDGFVELLGIAEELLLGGRFDAASLLDDIGWLELVSGERFLAC